MSHTVKETANIPPSFFNVVCSKLWDAEVYVRPDSSNVGRIHFCYTQDQEPKVKAILAEVKETVRLSQVSQTETVVTADSINVAPTDDLAAAG